MLARMDIATIQPVQGLPHLQQILRNTLPHYRVEMTAAGLVLSDGVCTGLQLKLGSPQTVKTSWIIPNVGVRLLWGLTTVLTGILPGLVIYGIIYLAVKEGVAKVERDVSTILRGGTVAPPVSAGPGGPATPVRPRAPGGALLVAAIAAVVIGLCSLGFGYEDFERSASERDWAARIASSQPYGSQLYGGYGAYNDAESMRERSRGYALSGGLKVTFGLLCLVGAGASAAFRSVKRRQFFALNDAQRYI